MSWRSADDVFDDVMAVCGMGRDEVLRKARGRGGNPAQRFAMWALRRETPLTLAQMGAVVGVSGAQVGGVLMALRSGGYRRTPIREWIEEWEERFGAR